MPRKEGQKLKLLTLLEIFVRETDEKHPISVPRMVELPPKVGCLISLLINYTEGNRNTLPVIF